MEMDDEVGCNDFLCIYDLGEDCVGALIQWLHW